MEALAISAANLDTIEDNLNSVAKELGGIRLNVDDVNDHINTVESKVSSLDDEIKRLVSEIRETTTITNARQNIMYNNALIEKKFGYYDNVRRTTQSILEIIESPNISRKSLLNLRENVILANPDYWLANALAALASWLVNDRETTESELNKALKKNEEKTSLFFCLVNLKIGRINTSINWLNKYLSLEDLTHLDIDFVTILDLAATGHFGSAQKKIIFEKINKWLEESNGIKNTIEEQEKIWDEYISRYQTNNVAFPYLSSSSSEYSIIINNLAITNAYEPFNDSIDQIFISESEYRSIDEIINNLIYKYEEKENEYQKENLKNNLIISNNGNLSKATSLYEQQIKVYDSEIDIATLLSNIIIYNDMYQVSKETRKIALSLCKKYIISTIKKKHENIKVSSINFTIDGFQAVSKDGTNYEEIKSLLTNYLNNKYSGEDRISTIILIVIDILGLIGIFFTMNSPFIFALLAIVLLIANIVLIYKMIKNQKVINTEKNRLQSVYTNQIDNILAEILDYNKIFQKNNEHYDLLIDYLEKLNPLDYMGTNDERNLKIGE